MKKLLGFLLFCPFIVNAQIPTGYYNTALGLNGDALKIALYQIIKGHTQLSYTPGLWNAYKSTDVKPTNGKLWTIYSDNPNGTPAYEYTMGSQQCSGSSPSGEGGCYNREHTWPQSKFNSSPPMYTDLWLVYPTDYYVNSKRGDLPYGKVGSIVKNNFTNGSKIGNNIYPGAPTNVDCFEPIDSFKGDIARTYFYITTRYWADSNAFVDWEMARKSTLKPWVIQMLLEWHHNDPVSAKEMRRNDSVFAIQHNRNPFIDSPIYVDCIWGNRDCSKLNVAANNKTLPQINIYPNPSHGLLNLNWAKNEGIEITEISLYSIQGTKVLQEANLTHFPVQIAIATLPQGLYYLKIMTKNGIQTEQLLLQ